jgi:hypothetical protein
MAVLLDAYDVLDTRGHEAIDRINATVLFPGLARASVETGLTTQSAFNRRLRRLCGAFLWLQEAVAQEPITPEEWVGPVQRCGTSRSRPIVSDRGFNGADWVN